MMPCDICQQSLSPMLDGELAAFETEQVQRHLATCADCQREWDELRGLDRKLANVVRLPVTAKAKCAALSANLVETGSVRVRTSEKWSLLSERRLHGSRPSDGRAYNWSLGVFALTAACLTLLFSIPRSKFSSEGNHSVDKQVAAMPIVVGRLVRATGPVEQISPDQDEWQALSSDDIHGLYPGARLRTGPRALCEIETPDKGILRLDASAELIIGKRNQFQLVRGRIWCRSSSASDIELRLRSDEQVTPVTQMATFTCPSSSEIQCTAGDDQLRCCSNSGNQATAQLALGSLTCAVAPGESVSVDAAQTVQRDSSQDVTNKIWQLPLLALDAGSDSELMHVLRPLLASIGRTKAIHMNEEQLRQLGPLAAVPLLTYATVEVAPEQVELRRRAVWLACELADQRSIPFLKKLADDLDPQIAKKAAETLSSLAH